MSLDIPTTTNLRRSSLGDEPIEASRYLEALRRSRWLMVAIVVILTGAVLALSLVLPKRYEASTPIVVSPSADVSGNTTDVQRQLATVQSLVTTRDVLAQAARSLPGETAKSLQDKVTASSDPNANIVTVTAKDSTAQGSANMANAVARAFLRKQTMVERRQVQGTVAALQAQISRLEAAPNPQGDVASQVAALKARLGDLTVAAGSAGSDLQVAQFANAPSSATSPRPARNAILAFFAALFIAVLVALGRDQLRPRIGSEREMAGLLGVSVLAGVPLVRRRGGGRANRRRAQIEQEAYQTLSAAVRLALPPTRQRIVIVTSALHAEGKTTVASRLARLMAQAGHNTLLVSGDLRWPKLDDVFEVREQPGLSELLLAEHEAMLPSDVENVIHEVWRSHVGRQRGRLDLISAGREPSKATRKLAGDTLEQTFAVLRRLDYTYVVVDAPPILGIADTQILARFCDSLLLVARLDRLTLATTVDLRDMVERIGIDVVGLVAMGARAEASPYYTGAKTPELEPGEMLV